MTCQNRPVRVLIQRVTEASVSVDRTVVGQIGKGLLALTAIEETDNADDAKAAAGKIAGLRIFGDERGKMNLPLSDIGGSVLVVSQFTLLADVRRGRRPSFAAAAGPEHARAMVERLISDIQAIGIQTATGAFGHHMTVALVNDGPVTLLLDIREGRLI